MKCLEHKLVDDRFFSALGTIETSAMQKGLSHFVGKQNPLTWGENNGVLVVCDNRGRPWIKSLFLMTSEYVEELKAEYKLRGGAYVPHSSDGGIFISGMAGNGIRI